MADTADTEGISKGKDSAEHKVVWIATRKNLEVAADALGERLLNSHLLHDLLHVKSSLPEISQAWLVAAELPANVEDGFEQLALSFTAKVLKQCPRMLMVVQPSLRRRSNRSIRVLRWNQHSGFKPFVFVQTCSCRVGEYRCCGGRARLAWILALQAVSPWIHALQAVTPWRGSMK